jgi:hypothetical protein
MTFSEETLMAYADNELDAQARSAVEAAMAADPEIARRVAQHTALRGRLRVAFDKVLDDPPPQRLVDAARGVPAVRREGNVIPLRRKAPPRRAWPQWTSLAASLVVGVLIGQLMLRTTGNSGPITASRDGKLVANGVLAQALAEQLASTQKYDQPVRIGVSFKSKDGNYCRTFSLREPTTLAGVACRHNDTWHLQVLAQNEQPAAAGTYRQAGSDMPRSVTQAVEDLIAGDALDARAENAAREQNWNPR